VDADSFLEVQNRWGVIRAGAKMIPAVSEATVPKLSVIVRKATAPASTRWPDRPSTPNACIALSGKGREGGPKAALSAGAPTG
jgi:methylmalonyl-CoA decarboxylase subunit alpha